MYILPDKLRGILKTQIGQLFTDEKKLIEFLKKERLIVSIGDLVTYTILKNKIKPIFCVIDYHTRRGECPLEIARVLKSFGERAITVKNPAGYLTDELWRIIKKAYMNLRTESLRIEVVGEEDLASLAAIYLAPNDVTIIYGLPDKGVLVVRSTPDNKRKVEQVLQKM
jgi:uncharacterized protein (UPF0218 family)